MFVLAANPCPCGNYTADPTSGQFCSCGEVRRRDYRRKLDGPVMDRIDITRHVKPVAKHEANDRFNQPESSTTVRERVGAARRLQLKRYAGQQWRVNGQAPGGRLRAEWPLTDAAVDALDEATYRGELTSTGALRVHLHALTMAHARTTAQH